MIEAPRAQRPWRRCATCAMVNPALGDGLTIPGPHTTVMRGPFSHMRTQNFLSQGALSFSQKVDDLF